MLGNGVIVLGDNLALLPWHLRVNLGTEDTSALVCQYTFGGGKGLRVLKRCNEEHIIISVECWGDARGVNRRPKIKNEGLHHTI